MEEDDKWYLAIDGEPDGPFTSREIGKNKLLLLNSLLDVKFRTNNLQSSTLAWKDGMSEWKPIFEIQDLKKML